MYSVHRSPTDSRTICYDNANKLVKTTTKTIISSMSGFTKAKKQNSRPLLHLEWKLRRLKLRKSSTHSYFAACKGRQSKCIQALRTNQRGSDRFSCRALSSSLTQTQIHEIDKCNKWNRLWWYKIYELANAEDGKSQKKAKRPSIGTSKNWIVVFSVVITTSSLVAGRWNWSAGNRELAPCLTWRISGGELLFCVKKWSFFPIAS